MGDNHRRVPAKGRLAVDQDVAVPVGTAAGGTAAGGAASQRLVTWVSEIPMDQDITARLGTIPACLTNQRLLTWVGQMAALCRPAQVYWADGSAEEYERICAEMVAAGTLIRLNPDKRPNSYLARSHPSDVARVEERTFICSLSEDDGVPPTTGRPLRRCAKPCSACSTAACAAGRCTSFRSAWGRLARRSQRSVCRSPTVRTSSQTRAS